MLVLGIESSCDETACAIVRDGRVVLSNVVRSQNDVHRPFGGVFPELACRQHIDALIPTLQAALDEAHVHPSDLGLIAAAQGPGLIGSLLIGLNAAKTLSWAWNLPFVGVNHVEAHLYATLMPLTHPEFPALGVVVSGGHTLLLRIDALGSYTLLGSTQDDAVGEAFDKVGKLLGLPYPGGPEIERLARSGNPSRYPFKAGHVKGRPLDFSFSGLKTSVLYAIKGQDGQQTAAPLSDQDKADLAASFQETALSSIVHKAVLAAEQQGCKAILCGGGVSVNRRLRELFAAQSPLPVHYPPQGLSLDNGAMIAGLGFHVKARHGLSLEPVTRMCFTAPSLAVS